MAGVDTGSLTTMTPEAIRVWLTQFGIAAPLIYVVLYAVNTIVLLPPIGIMSLAAGLAFGPLLGFLVIMAGAMLGTTATFFISRRLGRAVVERRLRGRFQSLDAALATRGFWTVLLFRLVPIVPYEALNYAAGLSRIRFHHYWTATILGLLPGAAIAAWFGDSLTQPLSWKFAGAAAALVALIAIPTIYLRMKRRPTTHGTR